MISNTTAKLTFVLALSLMILLAACGKGTSGLVQNSEAKSAFGWNAKVIEVSQPGTVSIRARSVFGGTEPEKAEAPPANQKWVVLSIEMTPPRGGASLPSKEVKLVDGANGYEALAMAGAPDKGSPAFVYFKDSQGLAQMDQSAQILWVITKNPTTGGAEISFQKPGGEKVYFLFAVPAAAKNLSLQLS